MHSPCCKRFRHWPLSETIVEHSRASALRSASWVNGTVEGTKTISQDRVSPAARLTECLPDFRIGVRSTGSVCFTAIRVRRSLLTRRGQFSRKPASSNPLRYLGVANLRCCSVTRRLTHWAVTAWFAYSHATEPLAGISATDTKR